MNEEKMTVREFMLYEELKKLRSQKLISINDIDKLMDQASKLLINYKKTSDSRDKWKEKYLNLKKEKKR